MPVIVSLLRGVNVGGHHKIRMDALRALYEELGLRDVQTCGQSGNVVFRHTGRDLARLGTRIEDGIERSFGFRPAVILRTAAELRDVIARNPFATRPGIDSSKLIVTFLIADPSPDARERILAIKADPEELRIGGRELYMYFPNGMARANLQPALIEKTLQKSGTGRNWNTVTKLLEMAETIEAS